MNGLSLNYHWPVTGAPRLMIINEQQMRLSTGTLFGMVVVPTLSGSKREPEVKLNENHRNQIAYDELF